MNLSAPFIHRPVMTTLVTLALLFIGVVSYYQLPVSNLPDVTYPTIEVTAAFPGASPKTMANHVATPLEKQFMTIPGITSVTSSNTLGLTKIVLQFDVNKSMDSAAQDVQAALYAAKANLPPNLPAEPTYKKVNPSDTPIVYIALTSDVVTDGDLYSYGYTYLAQRLAMLEGVAQVITYGSPYAVRVQVNPNLLAAKGISLEEVAHAIDQQNPSQPTGQIDGHSRASTILTDGQLFDASSYNDIVIAFQNGAPVRIKDIGNAVDSVSNDRLQLRYVDKKVSQTTVVLAVQRQPGVNTVRVSEEVEKQLPILVKDLPATVKLIKVFDRSDSIKESVHEVKLTLIIALFLVILVIFLYLGKVKETVIPSLALPMSIVVTFIVMYLLSYTIDNLSLLALTLAVGFIIDDAIVVLENIVRHVEEGQDPWSAALEGSRQISFTILSMTVSLAAVFIPMLFMGGLIGKIFREFAVTLVTVTLASGVISLTLTPMLCSLFIPKHEKAKENLFSRLSTRMNEALTSRYKTSLQWTLRRSWLALSTAALCFVGTLLFFKFLPVDFIPDDDIGFILAFSQGEEGTSSERMGRYQDELTRNLIQHPGIDALVSIAAFPNYRQGITFLRLAPEANRKSSQEIIQELYPQVMQIAGLQTFIKNVPLIDISEGTNTRGAYQYALQSVHEDHLYQVAETLVQKMQVSPFFNGVSSDLEIRSPQLFVHVKRDQAASYGFTAYDVENALLLAYSGNRVSRILSPVDEYDVIVELERRFQKDPRSLSQLYLRSLKNSQMVPLSLLADWKEGVGANSINHISQFPAVTISFNVPPAVPLGDAFEELNKLSTQSLTAGVTGGLLGAAQTFQDSINSSGYLLLLAIFAIYIVLGILYESFIHPITILSTLPPAIVGGLLTLYLFGYPLSMYGYLGIILLIGIVKKNGIMMVDYALENIRLKGETPEKSIIDAATVRFRPIMMTTMAAIFGAIPIAIGIGSGSASRRPLGLVIIGGLIVSQVITLYVTPAIYLLLEKVRKT